MGWFADYVYIMCYLNLFSSPSGDGLVLEENYPEGIDEIDFRPRVGMGWFITTALTAVRKWNFRPRVGMGWFGKVSNL